MFVLSATRPHLYENSFNSLSIRRKPRYPRVLAVKNNYFLTTARDINVHIESKNRSQNVFSQTVSYTFFPVPKHEH